MNRLRNLLIIVLLAVSNSNTAPSWQLLGISCLATAAITCFYCSALYKKEVKGCSMQSLSSTANTEQSTEYAFLKSFISLDTDHNDVITVNIAPNYGNTQFQHIQLKVLDGAIVVEPPCIREHSWPNGIKATVPVSTIRLYPRLFSPLAQVIGSVLAGQAGSFKDYVIIQDQELRAFNVQQSLHKASAKVRKAIPFG